MKLDCDFTVVGFMVGTLQLLTYSFLSTKGIWDIFHGTGFV
jgi:hypothetical protein